MGWILLRPYGAMLTASTVGEEVIALFGIHAERPVVAVAGAELRKYKAFAGVIEHGTGKQELAPSMGSATTT
jgi:hypothetical protein